MTPHANINHEVQQFMEGLIKRNPHELEFHQAVHEVVESVMPFCLDHPEYQHARLLERLTEPDRVVIFRVSWQDDEGNFRAERGWRVQFSNAIGPYKGGLRFHPSVSLSVFKFLGFEQIFKNALTGLPMGGAKGGANFNPKGKSDAEVMRFCQSFMLELAKHIGPSVDVPAGDIGVGAREIGYLFGQYKRLSNEWTGTMTGKGLSYGGSLIRKEATGYGCVYLLREMLSTRGDSLENKTICISGSGNVAIYAAEKATQLGAKVLTLSDSSGFIHDPDGIGPDKLEWVKELKEVRRDRIHKYVEKFGGSFHEGQRPWTVPCDVALPCATQNELSGDDAATLVKNGCLAVAEGANMPATLDAVHYFIDQEILYAPGKASNAGGVAVSGLEQSQNALRLSWTREEVDDRLVNIMRSIHEQCVDYGRNGDHTNYVKGANIAAFQKVGQALLAYGVV
jgi:glutamate dehydrogenase (NADP+)